MTATATVYRYDDPAPGAWKEFIAAMHSGQVFECDDEMWYYWLEVLPPVYMGRTVLLPDGSSVPAAFGFAEGIEHITAFWRMGGRFYGCRTDQMHTGN